MKVYSKLWLLAMGLAIMALVPMIPASQPAHAGGPWYVAPGGDDGNNCLSPATPCATINGAVTKASPGDTIYVATGMYTGTGDEVVLIDKDITLSGGWDATFTTQTGNSTIDGQGSRRGITVDSGMTVIIERFTVQSGSAMDIGGIYNQGSLTLNSSTVTSNTATSIAGGVYNEGTLTLNNSAVNGNTAGHQGGGIWNFNGTLILNSCTVSGNTTHEHGGGIINWGTLTLNNSTVSGNIATSFGGSIGGGIDNRGTLTLTNSTLCSNRANIGGGIRNFRGTLALTNSTVSGNTARTYGGGISNEGGILSLNSSTISGNTSDTRGGGVYMSIWSSGTAILQNSILAGNTAYYDPDCSGTIGSAGYNVVGSGCMLVPGPGDLLNADAKLGPLQNNGGSTATHALLSGSPAINAGDPAGCMGSTGLLTTDQRGFARFGRCDIGAYEAQSIKTVNRPTALPSDLLTYTIAFQNGSLNISNFQITDALPANLSYIDSSLTATGGSYGYDSGVITWTGSVDAVEAVTVTFGATVGQTAPLGTSIVNSAIISGGGEIITRTATVNVEGQISQVYLPIILKEVAK